MVEIPPVVARKAAARGADEWLAGLPALVADLAERWSLAIGGTFAGGTEARLADGAGLALLRRADEVRGAWLLERLDRPLSALGLPLTRRHAILCATAAEIWRPAAGRGLPTGADKARWFAEFIPRTWEATDRPCEERAVEYALRCVRRRIDAHDDERAVLVHGDVHQWNTLAAPGGFKLVDPDGLLATSLDMQPAGRQMLAAAECCAGLGIL